MSYSEEEIREFIQSLLITDNARPALQKAAKMLQQLLDGNEELKEKKDNTISKDFGMSAIAIRATTSCRMPSCLFGV